MFFSLYRKGGMLAVLLLLYFGFTIPTPSYAQSCKEGISKCKNQTGKQYRECIKFTCGGGKKNVATGEKTISDKINESGEAIVGIDLGDVQAPTKKSEDNTCKIGLHKCNSLRDESAYYWRCMKNTCKELSGEEDPNCDDGHRKCKFHLDSYWLCMSLKCKTPVTSFETCDGGIDYCSPDLNKYWNCVSRICLGDVTKFRNPDPTAEDEDYQENSPQASKYIIRGVPDKFKYPPKGVDPKEWVSITPPARTIRGSPSRTMRCRDFTSSIACADSSDILTCTCADGSRPETKPVYKLRNFKQKPF